MRELMLGKPARRRSSRWKCARSRRDEAYLSPAYGQRPLVISRLGEAGHRLLSRTCGRSIGMLGEFGARVHWGKLHFLTREQLHERYPRLGDFIEVRRRLDPDGVFLNDTCAQLFA